MTVRLVATLFCLLFLLLSGAAYTLVTWRVNAQMLLDADARLISLSKTLEESMARNNGLPALIGETTVVLALLQAPQDMARREAANAFLLRTVRENRLDAAFLLDRNGIVLASSNSTEEGSYVGEDYSFRPYFQAARDLGRGAYYGVGVTTGVPGNFLSARISSGDDPEDFGVVVAKTDFSVLEASWAAGGEHVFVNDGDGIVFLSSDPRLRYRPLRELTQDMHVTLAAEQRYGANQISGRIDLARELPPGQLASRTIAGTNWIITTVLPRSIRGWQPPTAAFTVLLIGLVAVLGGVTLKQQRDHRSVERRATRELEKRVVQRTRELTGAMAQLEAEMVERRISEAALQKARDELVQAAKLASMGQAFAGLAHEVNQPLSALKTYLSSTRLLIERGDTGTATANIGVMDETVDHLARLTNSLKHLSRRSEGRREPVDLAEMARRILELVKFRIRDAGVTVSGAHESSVMVDADRAQIEQIVLNLIKNAVEVARDAARREIVVVVDAGQNGAHLGIGDFGPGVPDALRGRLFEPFFTTKEVGKGLGLGLAISYAIAREHGGVLRYERTPEGQTWFHLHLPAKAVPPFEEPPA